ncbi:MAG TPA: aspartate aminotransferase family protein [Thermomicrobiales bacterium]|nr:aspartate aminotransferase family protein [Thermomicrobiales bacterium]
MVAEGTRRSGIGPELARIGEQIQQDYIDRTSASATAFERARKSMPGGDTRTVAFHPPYPLTIVKGEGYTLTDLDGNTYIDLLNNYTSLIHGHAFAPITEAVTAQLQLGTNYAAALEAQAELAERLTSRVKSVEKVRFTNSGTEATMMAIRGARAYTGRELIVKMEGGYHGTFDDFEVSMHPPVDSGPDGFPIPTIDTRGVPRNRLQTVTVIPFNDIAAAERIFAERGHEIAAVILEPVMGSAGMIPAEPVFLRTLRDLTTKHGALLMFDEVMAFRLGYGGMQGNYDIYPDITSFAKIMSGGLPGGAFGGSDEVMAIFDPFSKEPLWQSGTFNGNAITMVAGAAALDYFGADEVARINTLGDQLRSRIGILLEMYGFEATITGYGSFGAIHFTSGPVRNYRDAARSNQQLKKVLHLALLQEGLFVAPRLMFCISTPMSDATLDKIDARFERALKRLDDVR